MNEAEQRVAQVSALPNGKGLQYLAEEAYPIIGNPFVIHNMEYRLLAYMPAQVSDDPLTIELVKNGVFSQETIDFFEAECFIDAVADSAGDSTTIALLTSDKLKYDRLTGRIFNRHGDTVAIIVLVASSRPLAPGDAAVLEALCRKLSAELSRDDFFHTYGILYRESLIRTLIEEGVRDRPAFVGHIANLYEHMKSNIYVAAADFSQAPADTSLAAWRDLFKQTLPELIVAVYQKTIIFLLSSDDDTLNPEKSLAALSPLLAKNNIRLGLSSSFDNLYELGKYYREAVASIAI